MAEKADKRSAKLYEYLMHMKGVGFKSYEDARKIEKYSGADKSRSLKVGRSVM